MLPSFATETLTIYYPEQIQTRGTTDYRYRIDSQHSISVSGCSVQPSTTSETLSEPRLQELTLMNLWMPDTEWTRVAAGGTKRLIFEWRGMQFIQYGTAMPWISPTGTLGHVLIYLRAYEG